MRILTITLYTALSIITCAGQTLADEFREGTVSAPVPPKPTGAANPNDNPDSNTAPDTVRYAVPVNPRFGLATSGAGVMNRQPGIVDQFVQPTGRVAAAQSLLPGSVDSNDLMQNPFTQRTQLGDGILVRPSATDESINAGREYVFRVGSSVKWSGIYDTGFVSNTWSPLNIALNGSSAARSRGHFNMTSFNGDLKFDIQKADNPELDGGNESLAQAYSELRLFDDDIVIRRLYGRVIEDAVGIELAAGMMPTLFGDEGCLPRSIIQRNVDKAKLRPNIDSEFPGTLLVGGVGANQVVGFRVGTPIGDQASATLAVENPMSEDVVIGDENLTRLSRIPNVLARVRFVGEKGFNTYQVAALLRPIGTKRGGLSEQWSYGWGLSALARHQCSDMIIVYVGAVGGKGLGSYLSGLDSAAASRTSGMRTFGVRTLTGFGTFAGLTMKWFENDEGDQLMWSNFGYGYALQETTASMPATSIRKAQEAWCNLIFQQSDNLAYGVEYHYGQRDVRNGTQGLNHRIQLVLSISTGGTSKKTAEKNAAAFTDVYGGVSPGPAANTYQRRL